MQEFIATLGERAAVFQSGVSRIKLLVADLIF